MSITRITAPEFFELQQNYPGEELQFIDVRTADDYVKIGHVRGSVHIPYADLSDRAFGFEPDRPIYIIDLGGKMAEKAAVLLDELGFPEIYWIRDGIWAWQHKRLPFA